MLTSSQYSATLDENLVAISFGPAEQLLLSSQRWFTLTKVPKLCSEGTNGFSWVSDVMKNANSSTNI